MKRLTLIPIGGLANRFNAITSAIAFCRDYHIKLRVIWFKDKGMGANFHDLFELSEDVDKLMLNGSIIYMIGQGEGIFGFLIFFKQKCLRKKAMKKI